METIRNIIAGSENERRKAPFVSQLVLAVIDFQLFFYPFNKVKGPKW